MKEDPSSAVHTETRRLAAIMFTDIVGFSRQMGSNEARTLRLLDTHNQIIHKAVNEYHGNNHSGSLSYSPAAQHSGPSTQD